MAHRLGLIVSCLALLAACAGRSVPDVDLYDALTEQDISLAARLLQRTLDHAPDGATRRWVNDQSGHSGAITPVRSYIASSGQFCRDYREGLSIGDDRADFFYSACRKNDRWEL